MAPALFQSTILETSGVKNNGIDKAVIDNASVSYKSQHLARVNTL